MAIGGSTAIRDKICAVMTFDRVPFDDRAEEFQWLAPNSGRFQGEWAALLGNQLLAHSADYKKVSQEVKSLGIDGAMFMFIDAVQEIEDRLCRT